MRIISFIEQTEVIIHAKRNSLALQLRPEGNGVLLCFGCHFTERDFVLTDYPLQ